MGRASPARPAALVPRHRRRRRPAHHGQPGFAGKDAVPELTELTRETGIAKSAKTVAVLAAWVRAADGWPYYVRVARLTRSWPLPWSAWYRGCRVGWPAWTPGSSGAAADHVCPGAARRAGHCPAW